MGIATSLLKIERRAHPSNADQMLLSLFGGGIRTYTGRTLNEKDSLFNIPLFAGVRKIAETIASLPLHLYKRQGQGKVRAIGHPLYHPMHLQPNPEMTSMTYRETSAGHLMVWGNAYSEIERESGDRRAKALWPMLPGNMEVRRASNIDVEVADRTAGELYYLYALPSGKPKIILKENMLHIRGFTPNGIMGYSNIEQGREAIALGLGLEEYGARFFGNSAKPPAVIQHPGKLSKEAQDRLKKAWNEASQGLSNAHRLAILEEGMTLKEFGVSPEDAQALESRQFQVEEVCRLLNIPPHKLQDLSHATFSNIEELNIDWVTDTIRPWLVRIEQYYSTQLLREDEQGDYYFEHLVDGLLRGKIAERWAAYGAGFRIGSYSINDILALENRNPVEGGDERFVEMNMQPLSWITEQSKNPVPPITVAPKALPVPEGKSLEVRANPPAGRDNVKKAYHRLFIDAARRVLNKETIALKRAFQQHLGQRNITSLNEWIDDFYGIMPNDIKRNFMPVLLSYAEAMQAEAAREIGAEPEMTQEMQVFIDDYLEGYTQRHINSSVGQLQALIRDTDFESLQETLDTRADEWVERRPEKVANRETQRLGEAVASMTFLTAGFVLVWRTRGKSCPYCTSLEGTVVGRGQPFVAGNTDFQPEGAESPMPIKTPRFHGPLHDGCSCFINPE